MCFYDCVFLLFEVQFLLYLVDVGTLLMAMVMVHINDHKDDGHGTSLGAPKNAVASSI